MLKNSIVAAHSSLTVFILFTAGCVTNHQYGEITESSPGVSLRIPNYNKIFDVEVKNENSKVVWKTEIDESLSELPVRFEQVMYGVPPKGMRETLAPIELRKGDVVIWTVTYQYNSHISSNISHITGKFIVTGSNQFKKLNK